jgi:hypothetical protein
MSIKSDLASLEWEYATGAIGYAEYRKAVKNTWDKHKPEAKPKTGCTVEYNPEPHIAARTHLNAGGPTR